MFELIVLCDGHGMETAGKRTPMFPNGSFMRENEFNREVVALLDIHLTRCGFRTLLVAPTDIDTPLSTRTSLANKAKADLYLSVHANASGAGEWNGARGVETFHFPGSVKGKNAAEIIHRQLSGGTQMPNRGVKEANFQVLRETAMAAVLVECEFMTNQEGAKLLLSKFYREECAGELARGICDLYGRQFISVVEPVMTPTKTEEVKPKMKAEDANKIIAFLSASYAIAQDKASRDENRRLANELRIASGQAKQ